MHARCFPRSARRLTAHRRLVVLAMLLLLTAPMAAGCVRVKAAITISPNDLVSGQIIAAAKPRNDNQRNDNDAGPQFSADLPFSHKVAISAYTRDGYVGSQAVFSDLTFPELPQLASMSPEAAGVNLSLRRAGNLVILEGRVDLTTLNDPEADVELSVAFPGRVTSTNGELFGDDSVEWKLKPGVVNIMSAQARYTDPSTRSFTNAALWLGISSIAVAGLVAWMAWRGRDTSPRFSTQHDDPD